MRQIVPKASFGAGYGGATLYLGVLDGRGIWSDSATYGPQWARTVVAEDSVFRNFTVYTRGTFAAAVTITLLVDGAASALAVTLPAGQVTAQVAGPDVSVTAGQDVSYRYSGPVLPAYGQPFACCLEGEGAAMVFGVAPYAGSLTAGQGLIGGAFGNGVWEGYNPAIPLTSSTYSLCAVAGAVSGLCLRAYSGAPGTASWRAWIRKNGVLQDGTGGTIDTTTTLTGSATVVQQAFTLPGAIEDLFDVVLLRLGSDAAFATAHVSAGVCYTPTVDGAFMLCGGSNDAIPTSAPSWKWTRSDQAASAPTEPAHLAPIGSAGFEATALYIQRSLAPSPGNAAVHTLRRNETDTSLVVTVADTATSGSGTGSQLYAAGETIDLQVAPVGSAGGQLHWGIAGHLAAPVPPPSNRRALCRLRRAPHLSAEQTWQMFARFQLDLETGVGNAADPGADPQVSLRWSDDGGHTWTKYVQVSAGTIGLYRRRALWRRLGRSRDRVYEVRMCDPVKWALIAAYLDAVKGTS